MLGCQSTGVNGLLIPAFYKNMSALLHTILFYFFIFHSFFMMLQWSELDFEPPLSVTHPIWNLACIADLLTQEVNTTGPQHNSAPTAITLNPISFLHFSITRKQAITQGAESHHANVGFLPQSLASLVNPSSNNRKFFQNSRKFGACHAKLH